MAKGTGGVDPMLVWGAGAVALYAMLNQKKVSGAVASGVRSIMDAANRAIFATSLVSYAQPYSDLIITVADEVKVDPFLLFAIGDRETLWGTATAYKQETGDWTPRERTYASAAASPAMYKIVSAHKSANGTAMAKVMPADGLGWGRGLMQIDWGAHNAWIRSNNWRDPWVNVRKGAALFRWLLDFFANNTPLGTDYAPDGKRVFIKGSAATLRRTEPGEYVDPRPLWGEDLQGAALAAYNTGVGNVLLNIAAGRSADWTTAHGNYAEEALNRANVLASAYEAAGGTGTESTAQV